MKKNILMVNPYYEIGLLHNKILDEVVSKITPKTNLKKVYNEVAKFMVTQCLDDKSFSTETSYKAIGAITWNNVLIHGDKILPPKASYLQKQYFNQLSEVLDYCNSELMKSALIEFSNSILISELSEDEQKTLLIATSVGVESLRYWDYQYKNYDTSPWKEFSSKENMELRQADWGRKDLTGAVVGWRLSGWLGVGGLVGAAIGGACASIAAIVTQEPEEAE